MKFINKVLFSSLITISLLSGVKAEDDNCDENRVSIYNIHRGGLLYPEKSGANQYIGNKEAHYLRWKSWGQWGNWEIIYHEDKTVSFKNVKSKYCLEWYAADDQPVQNTCDKYSDKQKFELSLVSTGAYIIKNLNQNQCLNTSEDNNVGKPLFSNCNRENDAYHWALVPPSVGD